MVKVRAAPQGSLKPAEMMDWLESIASDLATSGSSADEVKDAVLREAKKRPEFGTWDTSEERLETLVNFVIRCANEKMNRVP